MRCWKNCAELLGLFGIETSEPWAERFVDLIETGALLRHFYGGDWLGRLERQMMRELHVSPLVFWAQIKRALRPLVSAGGDTLRALGVPVAGEPGTAHELAAAIVAELAPEISADGYEIAAQIREVLDGKH